MTTPRNGNLRTYLAGTGATGALIAGAIVAFLSVGAIVAFDGFPLGGDDAEGSLSLAEQPGGEAPEAAAAALAATPGAVADSPAGGTVIAAILPGGIAIGPGGPIGPGGNTTTGTGTGGGDNPNTPTTPGTPGGGPVSGLVEDVDETTSGLGLPGLGPATKPLTDAVDNTVGNTLNQVGGALGQPNLGDDVNNTVRGLTNGLLGREGLTGRLLGGN